MGNQGTPKSIINAIDGDEVVLGIGEYAVETVENKKTLKLYKAKKYIEVFTENEVDVKIAQLEAELQRYKDLRQEIRK
jgi:hypothetical protein